MGRYTRCHAEKPLARKITMNEQTPTEPMPKKSCIVTLMFEIKQDAEALAVKKVIDEAIKDIEKKRYNFAINQV
ncbi:hypothetical protein ES705_38410 [subsurface metagenome]